MREDTSLAYPVRSFSWDGVTWTALTPTFEDVIALQYAPEIGQHLMVGVNTPNHMFAVSGAVAPA